MEHWEEAVIFYQRQGAPSDQTALVNLLKEIQEDNGGSIPGYLLARMAERLQIKESFLRAVIRRLPSLRLQDQNLLELCAGPNCGKHKNLAAFAEAEAAKAGVQLRFLPCQRMCGKGPNLRFDGKMYHGADEELIRRLLK